MKALDVHSADGHSLKPLDPNNTPPAVVKALEIAQSIYSRAFGSFGQGTHWFAFEAGSVHECTKGGLYIDCTNEKYTFNTPIPGCT